MSTRGGRHLWRDRVSIVNGWPVKVAGERQCSLCRLVRRKVPGVSGFDYRQPGAGAWDHPDAVPACQGVKAARLRKRLSTDDRE